MEQHGDAKLSKILATFRPLGFICPQCNGTGAVREKYATDSLAVATGCADWSYRDAECPLCKGTGAVSKKLKPKMVQDGWGSLDILYVSNATGLHDIVETLLVQDSISNLS